MDVLRDINAAPMKKIMYMVQAAAMRRCRMEIILIILSKGVSIIRMVIIVMIMV